MLPKMAHPDGISKWRSVTFGGIVHTLGAGNGDIWDDENLVSDNAPVLTTRKAEHKITTGFPGTCGCLQIGPGENDTIQLGPSSITYKGAAAHFPSTWYSFSTVQTLTPFNNYAIIMPARYWIRTDVVAVVDTLPESANVGDVYCVPVEVLNGSTQYNDCYAWDGNDWTFVQKICGTIDAELGSVSVTIGDGTYAGVAAENNTIYLVSAGTPFTRYFSAGDGLTLSGDAFPTERTLVVREVYSDKLVFYEHSFDDEATSVAKSASIARKMPIVSQICVNASRAWGYIGKTVYASKLGDFKNWNVFDGLSSDSYAVDVLGDGDFTGCASFLGYPVFFKEDAIYKVYGSRPSNFEVIGGAATGCLAGRSIAVADDTLYYVSRVGVMRYSGGIPSACGDVLGDLFTPTKTAKGFSDGRRYFLWDGTTSTVLMFDPRREVWHHETISGWAGNISYAWRNREGIAFVSTSADLWAHQSSGTVETVPFFVEFADFTEDNSKAPQYGANAKGTSKLQLRMALGEGGTAAVSMKFDSVGDWITVKEFTAGDVKRSFYLPIIPRRSDHFRIRIEGTGYFELYSLARENYKGSPLRTR